MTSTSTTRSKQRHSDVQQRKILAAQALQRRRAWRIVIGAVTTVVAVAATLVVIALSTGGSSAPPADRATVPPAVLADLAGVPATTLTAVGRGTSTNPPRVVSGDPRTADGKPVVLYLGAEYCPFCAAQRWPLIQALSRFGTFTGLSTTRSAANDVHPNTASFTFHGATYTSPYLVFTAHELYTNVPQGRGYTPLDKATAEDAALLNRYGGSFPLVDFAGRYVQVGASYDITLLQGQEWEQIAGALANPKAELARAIDGGANVLTATLCTLTNQQPTAVCAAPAVRALGNG